jgi:Fe-S-cluster containining protein
MCCRVFPLPILDKAEGQPCKFLCASGCAIHDHRRPEVCRQYACYWLDHEEMPDEHRPDRIGAIVTESGWICVGGDVLPIFVLNQSEPESCRAPEAAAMVGDMVARGRVLLVIYGLAMQIVYDRSRYASISEAEIEVAFRYEQSQDALELKRLGVVDEDYRPLTWAEAEATVRDRP